jgi:pyruvate formate-lyase activating enzyme-like uncharacterized protein
MTRQKTTPENIEEDFTGCLYRFMPEGCRLCHQGAKLVLFVTGVCNRYCFYCPVSAERKGVDNTYANERRVESDEAVIEEARRMSALGTGITGGEPLGRLDRTLHYIRLLKGTFGKEHHIHLYTCTVPSDETLKKLKEAGLDELRMHPSKDVWDHFFGSAYHRAMKQAISLGMSAGIEIPALTLVPEIERAVADAGGFLNLNELEFSETNCEAMKRQGFVRKDDVSNAVRGSETVAREIVLNSIANTRYCSSRFKDAVQLRERLKRTASNVARPFDEITDDGTIICGEISGDLDSALKLIEDMEIPADMYRRDGDVVAIAWWILDEIREDLPGTDKSIVERYPLKNGLVVERIPL